MPALVQVPGYTIERLLSWGSQGDVFLGTDAQGQRVALKILTAERSDGDPQALARLAREAKLLAAVDSPHVVRLREFRQGEGWGCLVLELLDGLRLDQAVRVRAGLQEPAPASDTGSTRKLLGDVLANLRGERANQPTPAALQTPMHVGWALGIAVQLASGVAALHAAGLVHRDLKPQNVMLVGDRPVLIDFGMASGRDVTTLTQTGAALGTLAYLAPERFRGEGVDAPSSDVYALGATLHYCLTGSPPGGRDPGAVAAAAAARHVPDVTRSNPMVGRAFAAVIARCLEQEPRDRYRDAGELLRDLQGAVRGERVRVPFSAARLWRRQRRQLLGAAGLALAGGAVWAGFGRTSAGGVAAAIRTAAPRDPDRARELFFACAEAEQPAVLQALARQLGQDLPLATAVAQALQLALLPVAPGAAVSLGLVPCDGEQSPPSLPWSARLPAAQGACLLVRPGRVWCVIASAVAGLAWAGGDPLAWQCLLQLEVPAAAPTPRSLAWLGLRPQLDFGRWVRFAAGVYPAKVGGKEQRVQLAAPVAAAALEVSQEILQRYRQALHQSRLPRADLDAWLAHPEESAADAAACWAAVADWRQREPDQPALVGFFEAHRLATFFGCRLPWPHEWVAAVRHAPVPLPPPGDPRRRVPDRLLPVAVDPGWDRTKEGLAFAHANAAEWTLRCFERNQRRLAATVPMVGVVGDARTYFPEGVQGQVERHEPQGLRLWRTLLASEPH